MSKQDFNGAELIYCKKCGQEYELYFSESNEVISSTYCNCKQSKRIGGMKPLDYAINKLQEVLNGKKSKSTRKVSKNSKRARSS